MRHRGTHRLPGDYPYEATTTRSTAVASDRHGSATIEFPSDLEIVITCDHGHGQAGVPLTAQP